MEACFFTGADGSTALMPSETATDSTSAWQNRQADRETTAHEPTSDSSSSDGLTMDQFKGFADALFRAPAAKKQSLRNCVIADLEVGRRLSDRIQIILNIALNTPRAGRLDEAIYILGDRRVDLTTFLRDFLDQDRLSKMKPDELYVLIRAAGRRADDAKQFIIPWALKSDNISTRDAAVESLADIASPDAVNILHMFARYDPSPSIRETARDLLDDLAEA